VDIKIPIEVIYIIDTLTANGYESFAVGGCVRDAILGKEPEDWDICTSALPEQTAACFGDCHIIETGLKHGTITVVKDHKHFEVTTYRIDGVYSDNRRPDSVEFVGDLKDDLSRRDFTINAMAYNHNRGLVDYFGGVSDIKNKMIRCVGCADRRFQEDSLRIMRALRFASALGFLIDEETSEALYRNKELLSNVASERIAVELNKLLVGDNVKEILLSYYYIIEKIIPEIKDMIGFEQNNPHHVFDVWEHTVESITMIPADSVLRLTMLLHDIGKPQCYTEADIVGHFRGKPHCYTEANIIGHFHGHQQVSSDMARDILKRLKYSNAIIDAVKKLVLYHDAEIQPETKYIKRWLNKLGEEMFRQLILVKRADAMAQSETFRGEKLKALDEIVTVLEDVLEQQLCFSLKDLAINGRDLIDAGIPEGADVGKCLNRLLEMVIEDVVDNNKKDLLETSKTLLS